MSRPTHAAVPLTTSRWRRHAVTLAFGTFAVGTDAFVIAGLLPDISASLDISVAAAGQLVSVFSIAYAALSPVLAALTSTWSRRAVLLAALVVFSLGNLATALAPSYTVILAARVVAAAGAAMFTPNAGATAAALAGPERRGQAISIVTVGLTGSMALGAPLGTVIGNALGWKSTMWVVTLLALLVVPVIAFRLPAVQLGVAAGLRQRLAPLTDRKVVRVLVGTLLAFVGAFLPYTYISALFSDATSGSGDKVAVLLMVFGIAGTGGNLLAGRVADRRGPQQVVIAATLLMAAVFLLMTVAHSSFPAAVALVTVGGLASWSVTAPQQQRIISLAPAGAESLAVSLNAAVLYLAVSLASVFGAGILNAFSAPAIALVATAFALAAAAHTWMAKRTEVRVVPAMPDATTSDSLAASDAATVPAKE